MSTLTKLLPANAAPAQTLLDKAHALPLTSAQRAELPQVIHTPEGEVELGVPADQLRPVEVNDVFVDEKGGFWAVRPAVEKVLNVTGDVNVLREAAGALVNRGVRIAQIDDGFAVLPLPNLAKMLQMVGLEVTEAESPFDPIQFKAAHGGCGCGCHDDEDSCGCGHHHHHHDHDHDEHEHHHHHHDGEDECGCGHDHDHEHHHDHDDECSCGCGHHHHHHADEVFTSWGKETAHKYTEEELDYLLKALSETDAYGTILRSKGIIQMTDGNWKQFDLVPQEYEVRDGNADYAGRMVVIGTDLKEDELTKLFHVQ